MPGAATLRLDVPGAVAPRPAPTGVGNLTPSGGKLFCTGDIEAVGDELWVTDGTIEGTRLVKNLLPGAAGSYLGNLVDVGGVLYFNAIGVNDASSFLGGDDTLSRHVLSTSWPTRIPDCLSPVPRSIPRQAT